ncbi:MAG: DUF2203 domain-containing protein [Polyangiaceae bacterium]|nr:DUF2203 domain-containing protein [Polyangiaceae bacterium]
MAQGEPTGGRVFTLEEANALVPRLRELVGRQLERGSEIQALVSRLQSEVGSEAEVDVTLRSNDSGSVRQLKRKLRDRVIVFRRGWDEVQALGVVVKDTRTGLLDFYGQVDSRLVCLCWQYGETAVEYYHELDAGFAGRKPLDAALRKRLLN